MNKFFKFILVIYFFHIYPNIYSYAGENLNISFNGKAYNDTYFSTQNLYGKTFAQENLSLWLQGNAKFDSKYFFRAIYKGDGFETNNSALWQAPTKTFWRSSLREAFGEYRAESWNIKIGKQIISWGKSDGVNPTDFFSARDFSYLNPDDEVRRMAGVAFVSNYTPQDGASPWTFTLVGQFIFPQGSALIPPSLVPQWVAIGASPTIDINLENTEYGFKTSYAGSGWDASLSLFRGFNHQEELSLASFQAAPGGLNINFNQVYRRITAVGADASDNFGKWILRGEAAYIRTENDSASDPQSMPSHFDAVAGVERPLGDDFRISGQMLIRYFPNYAPLNQLVGSDPITQQINLQLASTNALLMQYQDRTRPSSSLRLAWTPASLDWSADVFFIYSFAGGDYLIKPQVGYKPIDNLKFLLGCDNYGGDATKPLGSLKPYNSIFFEGKYDF